jgi:hypothetical protein
MKMEYINYWHIATKFNRDTEYKKADVPKKDEKPIMGLVSDKNYIVANAVENILAGNSLLCLDELNSPKTANEQG